MRAGPIEEVADGEVVCRVHSDGTVEEHRQFWVLVAGDELSWQQVQVVM